MAITTDAFGNTLIGNFLAGDAFSANSILTWLRTALGSNDRANLRLNTIDGFRIDWRPNEGTTDEILTGVVPVPGNYFFATGSGSTLAANSRQGFAFDSSGSNFDALYLLASGNANIVPFQPDGTGTNSGDFTAAAKMWGIARDDSFALFVEEGLNSYFLCQGIFQNSPFAFPNNRYALALRNNTSVSRIKAHSFSGAANVDLFTASAVANFPHDDGAATTDEVELYLRRKSDNQHKGFAAGVIKITVDGTLTPPAIGDILTCDFSAATGFYSGYGTRKVIVVGRLGTPVSDDEIDITGDYLGMIVAG